METLSGYCIPWKTHKGTTANAKGFYWLVPCKINPVLYRVIIFTGHVPWLGAMILSHLEWVPDYKKFRAYAQAWTIRRIKEGSPFKDLFYHLVNHIFNAFRGGN